MLFDTNRPEEGEWYVIRVISGTENNVQESLLQRREAFNLQAFILDTFVPTHNLVSVRGGTKTARKKNIFPGYILVKMVVTNESWYIVRNTPNVTGFLGAGTVPVPVRGDELERLKGTLIEKAEEYEIRYRPGDSVEIIRGSFEGIEGYITEVSEKKGTVHMSINILGRDTPVEIDVMDVRMKK